MSMQSASTVNELMAKPANSYEQSVAASAIVNALLGTWGTKDSDFGLSIGVIEGWWRRYSQYWEAKLVVDLTGEATLTMPFWVNYGVVRVFDTASETETLKYMEDTQTLTITGTGRHVVRLEPVRYTRSPL